MSFFNQLFLRSRSVQIGGTIAIATAVFGLPACSTAPVEQAEVTETEMDETEVSEATQNNVTTDDLTDNLSAYLGQTVTVRQEAEEVIGESAFLFDDDQLFGGERRLVINASGEGLFLVDGDDTQVQATGEVRELVVADLETEYGLDLDPELYAEYEQQPVIVAESLALAPDPADLTDDPELYYGRRIAVNAEVEELWSADTMSVDGDALFGDDDLLVINPNATLDFVEDEEVVMTGVLQPFVASEIENEYELTWDLDLQEQIEAEYTERPVFVADEVYPSAL
jgi:hypothetical protein